MNRTPSFDYNLSIIDNADLAESTKRQYKRAIINYLETGSSLSDIDALSEYALGISLPRQKLLLQAINLKIKKINIQLKSKATHDNLEEINIWLSMIDEIEQAIGATGTNKTKRRIWLSKKQIKELMSSCNNDLDGRRDWIVLALFVGAGLRIREAINICFDALSYVQIHDNYLKKTPVLIVRGKGPKNRIVPINHVMADRIQNWQVIAGDGKIARSLGMEKVIRKCISQNGISVLIKKHGTMIGIDDLIVDDLRRSFAQFGYKGGIPIKKISELLGHSSIVTTLDYLNLENKYGITVSDFVPLNGG